MNNYRSLLNKVLTFWHYYYSQALQQFNVAYSILFPIYESEDYEDFLHSTEKNKRIWLHDAPLKIVRNNK